jgi:deoxycytidylate deaminase
LFEADEIERPEIVIGLVGALGTDLDSVEATFENALVAVGYTTSHVRVSRLLQQMWEGRESPPPLSSETHLDELMDIGDQLRIAVGHGGAAAALAVMDISSSRGDASRSESDVSDWREREAHATVVRSLKHPEEVRLLRAVYGPRFVLVGAWSPLAERKRDIERGLSRWHADRNEHWRAQHSSRLMKRDEKDGAHRLGQRVRDTFELADAYISLMPGMDIRQDVERIVRLLFGAPFETPTWEEQAMYQAAGARLRSADAGRQVGAVIVDEHRELLVTGTNEVPKAGGGQYWTGDVPDHRDFRLGYDGNSRLKFDLVVDLLELLKSADDWLDDSKSRLEAEDLARRALEGPLAHSRIDDLLEFGRVAHAEMAAICTAARRGTPICGTVMMTTTYPCHECARLIVASGISKVVYIDPYPKSKVPEMFADQVTEDSRAGGSLVVFEPFQGIAPRLYRSVFTMPDRTRDNVTGQYDSWSPLTAQPRLVAEAEALYPIQRMEDSVIERLKKALEAARWIPTVESDSIEPERSAGRTTDDHSRGQSR